MTNDKKLVKIILKIITEEKYLILVIMESSQVTPS